METAANVGTQATGLVLDHRYRVDALLARGGMSSVYRGVDLRLQRPVAIKIMDNRFADDRKFLDRFDLEARSAARLHHPHVVAIHDQGLDGEHAYLVMELVGGGTLRDLLDDRGALDPALALSIAEPVLSALAAAHAAELVHRDVKPENVLIGTDGTVKVADFGLVRAIAGSAMTSSQVILGTVAYLSPEQVATGTTDPRSDVYAVGVLLYEMLTGQVPYTGDTAISVAYRHVNDDVPAPSELVTGLPQALDEMVLRATRRDPSARPADGAALLAELREVRNELNLSRVPVPVPAAEAAMSEQTTPLTADPVLGPRGTRALPRTAIQPAEAAPAQPDLRGRHRPSRRTLITGIVMVALLGALIGAGAWWFSFGRTTPVPNVVGMDSTSAERTLSTADLNPRIQRAYDNNVPAGRVVRTDPPAGARATHGHDVTVVVSQGRPVVPDIAPGASVDQAEAAIRAAGLQPRTDDTTDAYDDTVPVGAVHGLDPTPGTPLNLGAFVTVVRSKGPSPKPIPDVSGMPQAQAFAALRDAGMQPYLEQSQFSATVDGGSVIRTDPPTGTVLPPGETGESVWCSPTRSPCLWWWDSRLPARYSSCRRLGCSRRCSSSSPVRTAGWSANPPARAPASHPEHRSP